VLALGPALFLLSVSLGTRDALAPILSLENRDWYAQTGLRQTGLPEQRAGVLGAHASLLLGLFNAVTQKRHDEILGQQRYKPLGWLRVHVRRSIQCHELLNKTESGMRVVGVMRIRVMRVIRIILRVPYRGIEQVSRTWSDCK
jgi:hypothetical protein